MYKIRLHLEAAGSIYMTSDITFDTVKEAHETAQMLNENFPALDGRWTIVVVNDG